MKAFIILSLASVALASLEPAGYRPPGSSSPSTSYLPANRYDSSQIVAPSSQYLPADRYDSAVQVPAVPATGYLPTNRQDSFRHSPVLSNLYLPADQTHNRYSAPSQYLTGSPATPSSAYLPPNSAFSSPSFSSSTSTHSGTISTSYGNRMNVPASRYLPANAYSDSAVNSGYRYNAPEEHEPAKYNFEYQVNDEYGNDFGHMESRDGDNTQGVYTVLLPDGRKQIVHYEANQEGFKPRVSYEEAKQGYSGYNRHGSQGHPEGPY